MDLSFLTGCAAEARYPSDMLEATNANVPETVEQAQVIGTSVSTLEIFAVKSKIGYNR